MIGKPKVILFDIETAPIVAYTWDLFPRYLSHDNIITDWSIICAAWKELGSTKIHTAKISKVGDDYEVVKKLRDTIAEADAVIFHNGVSFDMRKLKARIIFHKLKPLPKILMIDTKRQAKKIGAFSSNRLDYLSKLLTGQGKIHVEYQLWIDVMKGSKKALNEMVEYNKVDVVRLEEVYNILAPHMETHPHMGVLSGKPKHSCKSCGSGNMRKNGTRITAGGNKQQELQCNDCGSYTRVPYEV